jgi:hypothetical protein
LPDAKCDKDRDGNEQSGGASLNLRTDRLHLLPLSARRADHAARAPLTCSDVWR